MNLISLIKKKAKKGILMVSKLELVLMIILLNFFLFPAISDNETSKIEAYQAKGASEGLGNGTPVILTNDLPGDQNTPVFEDSIRSILNLSALILGIVNGLILLRNYLRDKPKLEVKPIELDMQWIFVLPDGEYKGQRTRIYGLLTYIKIINRGLRDVSLDSWSLIITTTEDRQIELRPLSIPQPQIELGDSGNLKLFPVLGQPLVTGQGGET